jgi:Uma2 family endonuclease
MATTGAGVSVEEYLRTGYRPDVEYIDGELKEKPAAGFAHGRMQAILGHWFHTHRKDSGVQVAFGTRTHVERTRYRLPDVVVVDKAERSVAALERPPLIAIEVLSPTDVFQDLRDRARDLRAMGTQNIWLIDPSEKSVAVWDGQTWQPFAGERLEAVGTEAYLDLTWLWEEFA